MIFEFVLGILFILYSVVLHVLSPGTFLDILTSFCNIWAAAGICLIFLSLYRKKHGCSLWSRIQRKWKNLILVFSGLCFSFALVNLVFILTPKTIDLKYGKEKTVILVQPSVSEVRKVLETREFLHGRTFVFLLGGGIDKNGNLPKPVIRRVEKAAEYMKLNEEAVCVVTGGTLKWLPYPEAPELKRQLEKRGISSERIFVEDKALDTIQNFQLGTAVLERELGVSKEEILESPVVAISSRYHLRRAQRLARRMGFKKVSGLGASTPVFYLPMSYLREICAYVKLNARILLTGKPGKLE